MTDKGAITIEHALHTARDHQCAGRLSQAMQICRQILAVAPDQPGALYMFGLIMHQCGQHHDALDLVLHSLRVQPDNADALFQLGLIRQALGQWEGARGCYERAVTLEPDFVEAYNNLGIALFKLQKVEAARGALEQALSLRPDFPEANNNLGLVLHGLHRSDDARLSYQRALELLPDFPEALNNLGIVLYESHQITEALRCYETALTLRPGYTAALNNCARCLHAVGQIDLALKRCRESLLAQPHDEQAHTALIYFSQFHPDTSSTLVHAECQRWNGQHAVPLRPTRRAHRNAPEPDRRLRIGYVSADLRDHPVSNFLLPLLAAHDHDHFEVHGYASVAQPDAHTARLRALADAWHDVKALSDEALAEQIRADGIDILVDLSQHTGGNRLLVFARQPAPVQVSWLGSPSPTGLETIGYRITDAHLEPVSGRQVAGPEQPVRLPDSWCCFDPLADPAALPVGEQTALQQVGSDRLTFGSLNNPAKHNAPTMRLWARVLAAVADSRLLLRCVPGEMSRWALDILRAGGVDADRVELVWREPTRANYLRRYQAMDVALDPSPYNGMTTSCEALWMGVPLLTLPGQVPGSRAGLSLLSSLGLGELAARNEDDYVRVAVGLAADLPRLAALRRGLRERMASSPLMDAPRFARHVEASYRAMWTCWCAPRPSVRLRTPFPKSA